MNYKIIKINQIKIIAKIVNLIILLNKEKVFYYQDLQIKIQLSRNQIMRFKILRKVQLLIKFI